MAQELAIRSELSVDYGNLHYRSEHDRVVQDFADPNGPYPGNVVATPEGTDLDLSSLGTPNWGYIKNRSEDYAVHVGVKDPVSGDVMPFLYFPPGVGYPFCLSPDFGERYTDTGTGSETVGYVLNFRCFESSAKCRVDIFGRT